MFVFIWILLSIGVFCNKIMFGLTSLISPHPSHERVTICFSFRPGPPHPICLLYHTSAHLTFWLFCSQKNSITTNSQDRLRCIIVFFTLSHFFLHSTAGAFICFSFTSCHCLSFHVSTPRFFQRPRFFLHRGISSSCSSSIHNSNHTFLALMRPLYHIAFNAPFHVLWH